MRRIERVADLMLSGIIAGIGVLYVLTLVGLWLVAALLLIDRLA